jgi:hypothetical protein
LETADTSNSHVPIGLLASVGAGALLVALLLFAVLSRHGEQPRTSSPTASPTPVQPDPRIRQAPWRIHSFPAGAVAGMTKRDHRNLRRARPKIAAVVRDLYDALFLNRPSLGKTIRSRFSLPAAHAFRSLHRVGPPDAATAVKTLTRRARIGIDARSARRAVATVKLRARGLVGQHGFRLWHEATLWLEREKRGWTVIAYDVRQRPIKRT